jgi:hypothetical protein
MIFKLLLFNPVSKINPDFRDNQKESVNGPILSVKIAEFVIPAFELSLPAELLYLRNVTTWVIARTTV